MWRVTSSRAARTAQAHSWFLSSARPFREGAAEGGCGGNSAAPERPASVSEPVWVLEKGSRKGYNFTAEIRNQKKRTKQGRAEGATLMHSSRRIQNPKEFSTLRVAPRLPIQNYD